MKTSRPALFNHIPNGIQLIFIGLIVFLSFLIFFILGMVLAEPVFGFDTNGLFNLRQIEDVNFLKYLQVVQSIGLFIIPPFVIAFFFHRSCTNYLQLNKKPKLTTAFYAAMIMIIALPAINLFAEINKQVLDGLFTPYNWMKDAENLAMKTTEKFLNVKTFNGMLFNVFMIGVLPAIGEELLFRGVLQKVLINVFKNVHIGIFAAAFLFSFIHFQFYGFLPRLLMGLFFGYLLVWSKSMWVPIIAHFINNGFAVVVSYLISIDRMTKDIEDVGMNQSTMIFAVISIIITGLLVYFLYKQEKRVL